MAMKIEFPARILAMLLLSAGAVWPQAGGREAAGLPSPKATQPVSEAEVKRIAQQFMAPCCWSQTADVHPSDTAKKMQGQIRAALQQGYDEQQIRAAFVAEYGERILSKPEASGFNLAVWLLPGVALVTGGLMYWRYVQRVRALPAPKPRKLSRADESYSQRFERELAEYDN